MVDPRHPLVDLLRRDKRFHYHAYVFVSEALRYGQENLGLGREEETSGESLAAGPERHVTGQELCEAIRYYALEEYGLMAKVVLGHWGVKSTSDFGEIVFNLIEIGEMKKTARDRREDFEDVFDFDEAFCDSFKIRLPDSSEEHLS